jgi:hypothetical protein
MAARLVRLSEPAVRSLHRRSVDRQAAEHGNCIVLLHARTEAEWFEPVWKHAAAILFLADRIYFHRPDGSRHPANSGAPAVLCAFGDEALARLQRCGIAGVLVTEWQTQSASPARECAA